MALRVGVNSHGPSCRTRPRFLSRLIASSSSFGRFGGSRLSHARPSSAHSLAEEIVLVVVDNLIDGGYVSIVNCARMCRPPIRKMHVDPIEPPLVGGQHRVAHEAGIARLAVLIGRRPARQRLCALRKTGCRERSGREAPTGAPQRSRRAPGASGRLWSSHQTGRPNRVDASFEGADVRRIEDRQGLFTGDGATPFIAVGDRQTKRTLA
jgi:hypothetical protein